MREKSYIIEAVIEDEIRDFCYLDKRQAFEKIAWLLLNNISFNIKIVEGI